MNFVFRIFFAFIYTCKQIRNLNCIHFSAPFIFVVGRDHKRPFLKLGRHLISCFDKDHQLPEFPVKKSKQRGKLHPFELFSVRNQKAMAEETALTLANSCLDVQIAICMFLHPSDILALRKVCRHQK